MRPAILLLFAFLAPACFLSAQSKIDLGELNGANYRIDMPANWNGGLIMYCHGYSGTPGRFTDKPIALVDAFTSLGYAVSQSGYVAGGWTVKEASENTAELQRFFLRKYGAAKEVFIIGHSMGGFLTTVSYTHLTLPTIYSV